MKRLLLALAGYALYRWWTSAPNETGAVLQSGPAEIPRKGHRNDRKPA